MGLEFIKKKTRGTNKTNEQKEEERFQQLKLEKEKIQNYKKRKREKSPIKNSSWQYIDEKSKSFITDSVNNKLVLYLISTEVLLYRRTNMSSLIRIEEICYIVGIFIVKLTNPSLID